MGFESEMEATPPSTEQLADLQARVLERAAAEVAAAQHATDAAELFIALPSAAIAAFRLGQYADAEDFAQQCLSLAPQFARTWNHGNAIHFGYTTLGLLALERGGLWLDLWEAKVRSGGLPNFAMNLYR